MCIRDRSCVDGLEIGNALLRTVTDLIVVFTVLTAEGEGHIRPPNVLPLYKPAKLSVNSYVRVRDQLSLIHI